MTDASIRELLRQRMLKYQTQSAGARAIGMSQGHVSSILNGKVSLGKKVLRQLGLADVVVTKEVATDEDGALAVSPVRVRSRKRLFRFGDWPVGLRRR